MEEIEDKAVLRARDFWAAIVLMAVSLFFLWKTSEIPLFGGNRAGVSSAAWYNSAAIVPLGIFIALFVLSVVLLVITIREGGAQRALTSVGIGWDGVEALRFVTLAVILFSYIACLVPRVDFIISSGLLITAMIYGYRGGETARMKLAAGIMFVAGFYALIRHFPQAEWAAHDDDWLALALWLALTIWVLVQARADRVLRFVPVIAVVAPIILVTAMAFGFRQNIPNRGGLLFEHIQYHYYVTLRPLWRD